MSMRGYFLGAAVIATISAGCSTYKDIQTVYDTTVDFNQYRTFAWMPDSGQPETKEFKINAFDKDIVRNNAKNYVNYILTKRGYRVDIDSPQVVLELVLLNEKKERIVEYHTYLHSGYYYNPFYFPYYYPYYHFYTWHGWHAPIQPGFWDGEIVTYTTAHTEGTVTINMYDRELRKLVWSGTGAGNIYDPAYIHFDAHPIIVSIMKECPLRGVGTQKTNGRPVDQDKIVRRGGFRFEGSESY